MLTRHTQALATFISKPCTHHVQDNNIIQQQHTLKDHDVTSVVIQLLSFVKDHSVTDHFSITKQTFISNKY